MKGFIDALARALPADRTTQDEALLLQYGSDWTKVHTPNPSILIRPKDTDEVQRVVQLANEHEAKLVPSGGRTGLAGGAVAQNQEAIVSLERLTRFEEIDTLGLSVKVGAGVITETVHDKAREVGLTWPVDFASKGSSQVGGNIATNAGGIRVIRFGLTRNWVLGLTVVTGAGDVLTLNGALEKNNTGIDLRQLFIGSVGILGIVTEAVLKLTPLPPPEDVYLFGVRDLKAVLALFRHIRSLGMELSAFEFMTDKCLDRLKRHRGLQSPLGTKVGHYVVMQVSALNEEKQMAFLGELLDRSLVEDGTVAENQTRKAELWALREGISESLSATGLPHKNDIALPLADLEAFEAELTELFAAKYPNYELCLFGHIGDGNLHVNVMKPEQQKPEAFFAQMHEVDGHMFELVRKYKGSVSAEHGIGLLKKDWLSYTRSAEEISLMRAMKRVFDPNQVLNPGKVI